jgi:hypothetical protein
MKHIVAKAFGVFCLALSICAVAVGPATAAEPAGGQTAGMNPIVEPMSQSECPSNAVCFWSGKTYGQAECESGQNCFSWFSGSEVGYHALSNINPQSVFNNSSHSIYFSNGVSGGWSVAPGHAESFGQRWFGGFEIL